jgi:hypothetical protein
MRAGLIVAMAAMFAACGGGGAKPAGAPTEDPGDAMVRLVQHELNGRLANSYAMLVKEQRSAVDRDLYVSCPPGFPRDDVRVAIVGVRDAVYAVPGLGKTDTKAVTYEMSIPDARGNRMKVSDTGHLVAQDGEWRWTLSSKSLAALRAGACP